MTSKPEWRQTGGALTVPRVRVMYPVKFELLSNCAQLPETVAGRDMQFVQHFAKFCQCGFHHAPVDD